MTPITSRSDACRLRRAGRELRLIRSQARGHKKGQLGLCGGRVNLEIYDFEIHAWGIAALVAGFAVFLVLRVYIVQELLGALFLFSLVFAAVALFCFALVLLDWSSEVLIRKVQGAVRAHAALAYPVLMFREHEGRKHFFRCSPPLATCSFEILPVDFQRDCHHSEPCRQSLLRLCGMMYQCAVKRRRLQMGSSQKGDRPESVRPACGLRPTNVAWGGRSLGMTLAEISVTSLRAGDDARSQIEAPNCSTHRPSKGRTLRRALAGSDKMLGMFKQGEKITSVVDRISKGD